MEARSDNHLLKDVRLVGIEDMEARSFMRVGLGIKELPAGGTIMAFRDEDGIMGGWLFERYTGPGGSVFIHWAGRPGKSWMRRYMLTMVAMYVFDQLKCAQALGEVKSTDEYVRKVDEKLGFEEVAVVPAYFPDADLVLYRLRKSDCRWLPDEFKEPENG